MRLYDYGLINSVCTSAERISANVLSYSELARRCGCMPWFAKYLIKGQRRAEKYEACVARFPGIPRDHLDRLLRP